VPHAKQNHELFMVASIQYYRIGVVFYLATIAGVCGQVATTSQPAQLASSSSATLQVSQNQATVEAFQTQQISLARQEQALAASGATPGQLAAWYQQNSTLFSLQQQRAETMAAASESRLQPENRRPRIPANASPTLADFLTAQATLANARAHIHNQLVQAAAAGLSLTFAQATNIEQQENQLFQQQNVALLALQAQRSQLIANESAAKIQPVPGRAVIPPNASPQMAAYLTGQNQIRREMVQWHNQNLSATPAARQAALQTWYQQNASQFSQVQQQAQTLSQASTTTKN
jgi:hypothetical protein